MSDRLFALALAAAAVPPACAAQPAEPDPSTARCAAARERVAECLGGSPPAATSCTPAESARADRVLSTSCEELRSSAEAAGGSADDGGIWCEPWLRWADRCCHEQGGRCDPPELGCDSELGRGVFARAWRSNHGNGTVPSELLLTSRNEFEGPLETSREVFPTMADLIAEARHEVAFVTFDFAPTDFRSRGVTSTNDPCRILVQGLVRLEERLAAERAAGDDPGPVTVRFVIDGAHRRAPSQTGGKALREVRALVAQVERVDLDPSLVDVRYAAHERWTWGAVHSKLLVVDGVTAVLAGTNPQPFERLDDPWRDVGIVVRGEIGMAFQRDFDDTWERATEVTWCDTRDLDSEEIDCEVSGTRPIDHPPEVESPDLRELEGACVPMFAANRRPHAVGRTGWTFENVDNPQDAALIGMYENARETIRIESPNLNDDRAMDEIVAAAGRGVEVRILLSLGFNAGAMRREILGMSAGGANVDTVLDLYRRLGERGLCDRVRVRWVSRDGVHPTWVQEPGATHSKLVTVDGQMVFVGSANQDNLSWNLAQESNVLVDSRQAATLFDRGWFDPGFGRGIEVFEWAGQLLDGEAELVSPGARRYAEHGMDLKWLYDARYGSPEGWAEELLAACR